MPSLRDGAVSLKLPDAMKQGLPVTSPVVGCGRGTEVQGGEAPCWKPLGRQNLSSACPGGSEPRLPDYTHAEVSRLPSGSQPVGPFVLL